VPFSLDIESWLAKDMMQACAVAEQRIGPERHVVDAYQPGDVLEALHEGFNSVPHAEPVKDVKPV
jgi:hypothetical protein